MGHRSARVNFLVLFAFLGVVGFQKDVWAQSQSFSPDEFQCYEGSDEIPVNNEEVLEWKDSTPNQYEDRAHVIGKVVRIFKDSSNHDHIELQIGDEKEDVIEIISNKSFGELPDDLALGTEVEVCGDYITATARSGPYSASPSGAIIHWVHQNPKSSGHEHGFVVIDGIVYGWEDPKPRKRK